MEFKDRIELLMKTQHMNRQVFGQLTGLSQSTLSNIFNGKTQPTLQMVLSIKSKMPSVNTDWLLFGIGRMFNDQSSESDMEVAATVEPALDFGTDMPAPSISTPTMQSQHQVQPMAGNYVKTEVKYIDKPKRQITEIRIFYDDQTWETFVPKK